VAATSTPASRSLRPYASPSSRSVRVAKLMGREAATHGGQRGGVTKLRSRRRATRLEGAETAR
jgi:hypothetical protein